jgi:hypothetical protein
MKYSQWIGIIAAVILVIACFMPWTYHPDLQKNFTGFFSENRIYGKPGNVFIFFAVISVALFLFPRVWAKRANLLFCAMIVAYAIRSFIMFSGCYRGICPEKKAGLWLMLAASALMMIMALLPDTKMPEKKAN